MYSFLNRPLHRCFLKIISTQVPKHYKQTIHEKAVILTDALDEFTCQLTQKKASKWNNQKITHNPGKNLSSDNVEKTDTNCELENCTLEMVNLLLQESIQMGNNSELLSLTRQCVKYRKCPSISNLTHILTFCAQNGDKDTIILVTNLYGEFHPDNLKANSYFKHYLAEAIWVKGNIVESLKIFKEVYIENTFLRRRIRLAFRYLVQNIISTRSEAALINVVNFAEELLTNYKDFFPLVCVWQSCFVSEWFTDQCFALNLLEKNEGLLKAIIGRIPYVVSISLNSHRTEVVYRLLELLLKYKMKMQYSGVLSALLDYQISQRDLRRSTEIICWSVNNNVPLLAYQNEKFLELLLSNSESSEIIEKVGKFKTEKVSRDFKF